jgi:hypothetical protein
LDEDCRRHERLRQRRPQGQLPPFLVVRWIDLHDGLIRSAATERELIVTLARPHIAAVTIPSFRDDLAKMLARAELVAITERIAACRDPLNP